MQCRAIVMGLTQVLVGCEEGLFSSVDIASNFTWSRTFPSGKARLAARQSSRPWMRFCLNSNQPDNWNQGATQ